MNTSRREINTIRTDQLEIIIARYRANGDYEAADAIENLAREIGAPIDDSTIAQDVERRRAFFNGEK